MSVPSFANPDGSPNAASAYWVGMIVSAVGRNDPNGMAAAAATMGGTLDGWVVDHDTVPPDFCVITGPGWVLVAFYGTTNKPQAMNYAYGAVMSTLATGIPSATSSGIRVNWGFQSGLDGVQGQINSLAGGVAGKVLLVAGHSYGAAAAQIYARRMANLATPPTRVEVITFGGPKAFDSTPAAKEVDYTARMVAAEINPGVAVTTTHYDPVPFLPPKGAFLTVIGTPLLWLGPNAFMPWTHLGEGWTLEIGQIKKFSMANLQTNLIAELDAVIAGVNFINVGQHYMISSYLPKLFTNYQAAGASPDLSALNPYYQVYVAGGSDTPPAVGPAVPSAVINQNATTGGNPVTDGNRDQFSFVTAQAHLEPGPTIGSVTGMSFMKGTIDFNSTQGGWSESVYSTQTGESLASMTEKMKGLLTKRMKLSMGPDATGCRNPVLPFAIRVVDVLNPRASQLTYVLPPGASSVVGSIGTPAGFSIGGAADASNQNLDLELGTRVKTQSGVPLQYAYPMFHGVPFFAMQGVAFSALAAPASSAAFLRNPGFKQTYIDAISNMYAYMFTTGIGYRNIAGAWNAANNTSGPFCTPDCWQYDTALEQVVLLWASARVGTAPNPPFYPVATLPGYNINPQASANWPNVGALCRLQVRGWKDFALLNGRWAAQVVAPFPVTLPNQPGPTSMGFALRIKRKVRLPQVSITNVPQASPIAWTPWAPSQVITGFNPQPGPNPTITITPANVQMWNQIQFIESKKLGRPFGLERGRQRNRAT